MAAWSWLAEGTIFAAFDQVARAEGSHSVPFFGSLIAMTFRARILSDDRGPHSRICVHPGQDCDLTLQVTDSGHPVNWSGHRPRFRIYSQIVDRLVVLEITDSRRCRFEPEGIWRLCLTGEEIESLPRGGMRFTLEHGHPGNEDYQLAVIGGVSCTELRVDNSHATVGPHYQR